MGIYYNPPPPAGRSAVTPPEPHVPIGNQGNQPPRYTTALMLVAVLASWPADLEPRLTRPNDQQQKIAPLTLTYGAQPTPQGPLSPVEYWKLVTAWPPDLEPRLGRPNNQQQTIAPLTLTYGAEPTRQATVSPLEMAQIAASWAQTWDAQTAPRSTAWSAPLPPFKPYTAPPAHLWTAWDPPWLSPPRPVAVAPLTLSYGAQPSPQPALSTLELAQIAATWTVTWDAQTAPKSAAWNVPPLVVTQPYRSLARQILTAWDPPWVAPPTPVTIAPLTLATGDQPPVQSPVSTSTLRAIVVTWAQEWSAQTAPSSASWNVPPIVVAVVPCTPPPALLWTAWVEPFVRPPVPVNIAPLTLTYGVQPLPQAPLSVLALTGTVATWVQTWDAQTAVKDALLISLIPPTSTAPKLILVDGKWAIHLSGILYESLE